MAALDNVDSDDIGRRGILIQALQLPGTSWPTLITLAESLNTQDSHDCMSRLYRVKAGKEQRKYTKSRQEQHFCVQLVGSACC